MNNDLHVHYEAVLGAERAERDRIRSEIGRLNHLMKEKDRVIASLAASLGEDDAVARSLVKPLPFPQPVGLGAPYPQPPDSLIFAGISVRWSILGLMSDHVPAEEVRGTAEMAEALAAGGVRSGGLNFVANVSAVVSDMVKNRQELEPTEDGKYRITQKGRETWQTIKVSRRYRTRLYAAGYSPSHAHD
jgi:hypothetical protein